jgi:uncharacterized membrane protein YgcG
MRFPKKTLLAICLLVSNSGCNNRRHTVTRKIHRDKKDHVCYLNHSDGYIYYYMMGDSYYSPTATGKFSLPTGGTWVRGAKPSPAEIEEEENEEAQAEQEGEVDTETTEAADGEAADSGGGSGDSGGGDSGGGDGGGGDGGGGDGGGGE